MAQDELHVRNNNQVCSFLCCDLIFIDYAIEWRNMGRQEGLLRSALRQPAGERRSNRAATNKHHRGDREPSAQF